MGIELDIQEILDLGTKTSSVQSEAVKKFKKLQAKIKTGATTGDRIKDFVIAYLGFNSLPTQEAEKPYRTIEAQLKNKTGKQILVVKQHETITGCPGIVAPASIRPMNIGIQTEMSLGILTSGLELDIANGDVIFPTKKHVTKYDYQDKWELNKGSIVLKCHENFLYLMDLGKEVETRLEAVPNNSSWYQYGMTIHVGNEVEDYFRRGSLNRFFPISHHLKTDKKQPVNMTYVEALKLIGQEIPEGIKGEYEQEISEKRKGIITEIEKLVLKESRLEERIKAIYRSAEGGGFMQDGAIVVVEDEDDAKIVSWGEREALNETRREIQSHLKKAIEFDMHKGDLRIEQRLGVEFNVNAYIAGMCEKYKVEIPA